MKNLKIIVALMMIICVMVSAVACNLGKECEHADENLDHQCDLCSEAMGECADANKDHKCDYGCDKAFGTHEAADGSHSCAYCGVKISECTPAADDGDCTTAILCTVCEAVLTPAKSAHEAGADDGDCTTAVKCANCDQIAVEAKAHVAGADDGDCTTAVKCANCDKNAVEAGQHTPNADDGNCLTAIVCSVCGTETTPAKSAHEAGADDGDCTTAVKCANCDQNAVEAKAHVAGADDGDCTTAVKCANCDKNAVEAKAHVAGADDGDCTTAIKCANCDQIAVEAKAHVAGADDGNCTTPVKCVNCEQNAISAGQHTPKADDGNCMTAIVCSVCGTETTPAKSAHEAGADDGDCTTAIKCANCDQNAVEAKAHVAGADDGDCTTAVKCANCEQIVVAAKDHVANADDGDCTTNVVCSVCGKETTAAKQHATKLYFDGANGHHSECDNEGCDYATESVAHARAEEGKCACGYVCENICKACNACTDVDCALCETLCYFVDDSRIVLPFVPGTTMENKATGAKTTMNNEEINGLTGVRYVSNTKMDFRIIRNNGLYWPYLKSEKVYFHLVIKNNGENDVELTYKPEYYGYHGDVTAKVPAGETVEVLLVQNELGNRDNAISNIHDVIFKSGNDNGFDITIAGMIAVPKKEIKVEGAKINGSNVIETAYGLALDASAEVTYDRDQFVLGWEYNGTMYDSYASVAAAKPDPYACDTIKVIYFDDESRVVVPFVPSTRMENKNYTNSSSTTMETVEINGLTGVRYVANDKRDFRIGNTANNYCPVLKNDKVYYHLVIKNNGDTDVEFKYQPEYWGVRGEAIVKVAAGETVEVLLVQNALGNRDSAVSSVHDVIFNSGNDNGYDITIAGYTSVPKHDLKIEGATIDGKDVVGYYYLSDILADAVFNKENNYGWVYNGRWYESIADLKNILDPGVCDTIKAVYEEDFTTLFVPNAKPERINGGSVLPTAEYVKDADGNIVATRFSAAAGDNATYFKLLNNSNHASGNANYINNVFGSSKSCILLTLKNNSENAVTLTYEIEYFGVRGSTTVTLAAGEEKTVFVTVAAATGKADSNSAFHQIKMENAADGYDLTVYGYRVV